MISLDPVAATLCFNISDLCLSYCCSYKTLSFTVEIFHITTVAEVCLEGLERRDVCLSLRTQ